MAPRFKTGPPAKRTDQHLYTENDGEHQYERIKKDRMRMINRTVAEDKKSKAEKL